MSKPNIKDEDAFDRVQRLQCDGVQPDVITDWEWEFLASVRKQIERGHFCTEKQLNVIERIEAKFKPGLRNPWRR